jgi:plastocyanin
MHHDSSMMKSHVHENPTPTVPGAREIAITARNFRFDPSEIRVRAGEPVTIVLTSEGSLHDFTLGDGAHVSADAGKTARGGLKVDAPGTHTFYCTVPGHRSQGMEGKLIVEDSVVPIPPATSTTG